MSKILDDLLDIMPRIIIILLAIMFIIALCRITITTSSSPSEDKPQVVYVHFVNDTTATLSIDIRK